MLFMVISRTRPDLRAEQLEDLARLARRFYAQIPAGVRVRNEWTARDGRQLALLEAPDEMTVAAMQTPFAGYVEIDILPVSERTGWTA
ncbi:MAG: hypothetical protein JSR67_04965 [Proteobacteria bacterium]|nr:hypothetical protein [Pseudomonadota bacterium]